MSSVADGEMSDQNLSGFVVDKNGFAVSAQHKHTSSKDAKVLVCTPHASSIFLRRGCILSSANVKIVVAEELPFGVQLRVSSICLLRSVIRGHPDAFFDAETSTPIGTYITARSDDRIKLYLPSKLFASSSAGNIRPHVISLLFRSLVSCPLKAVVAAHDALRDVLTLSVVAANVPEGGKSKSRLPKELLQTCIRPVLLNLRDYAKLSVFLLRGLSRLLSLLSSWFNKTLGEKLLDHLQKWTDPPRIKSQHIWKEGEEPGVAAAIVDLFALLPHASHFVEPLVKTTIKLEACLPSYKARCVVSPYRKPLARYLNRHCQQTVGFFFSRLKTPLYSELFQDIVKFEDSKALREYLSGRQCSVTILNVCFERPLAIVRLEKTSTGGGGMVASKGSTSELLALHGLESTDGSKAAKEIRLRQDLERKKRNVQALKQEVAHAQELVQSKSAAADVNSSPDMRASLEEAKRQLKAAKGVYERGIKDFNESKQRYTAEVAQAQKAASMGDIGATTRPMNIESLELQHQGFRLVETLIENNKDYLRDHNDVLRAFRWLWRSKGRYLRLQHEESLPPRYHRETKMLSSFLVDYARNFPDDVDVLFELIRIFLQSTTNDFSFVKSFLADAVADKLTTTHKRQIIQRFFALLAGESPEENKTLSIQLVVYPMLRSTFQASTKQSPLAPNVCQPREVDDQGTSQDVGGDVVDTSVVKKFVKEVLFQHEGKPIMCGDRLKVELLRISDLLLQFVPKIVEEFRNDMIKFCWSLLKSDDTSCKCWAYVVVCRFIAVFDTPTRVTPAKLILQVYSSLLRAHQQEGKELVRNALKLLVPALRLRLQEDEFQKMIEQTNRIVFEDGNSVSQLAHIWHTIINHDDVYCQHRHQFVRFMVNSLNRLGLPPSCPMENRSLAVSIVELVMKWEESHEAVDPNATDSSEKTPIAKRKSPDSVDPEYGITQSDKKRKTAAGSVGVSTHYPDDIKFILDQSMVSAFTASSSVLSLYRVSPPYSPNVFVFRNFIGQQRSTSLQTFSFG